MDWDNNGGLMADKRRQSKLRRLIYVLPLVVAAFSSQTASASPACLVGTIASYTNSFCQIGNIEFHFRAINPYQFQPDDVNVNDTDVIVTPVGLGTPLSPTGFLFAAANAGWLANNPDLNPNHPHQADINLTFDARVLDAGGQFISTTLEMVVTIPSAGTAFVNAAENVINNNGGSPIGDINLLILGETDATSQGFGGTALSGSASLAGATDVNINKDLLLWALVDPSSVQVNSIQETFLYDVQTAPEPGPFVLTGAGILGFVLLRRRGKKFLGILGVLALVACFGTTAHASPVCLSGTIASYIAQGTCSINDVDFTFTAASYVPGSSSGAPPLNAATVPAASAITVTPLNNVGSLGFQFVPVAATVGSATVTMHFEYTAKATATSQLKSLVVSDTASTNGNGSFNNSNAKIFNGVPQLGPTIPLPAGGSATFAAVAVGTTLKITDDFNMTSGTGLANQTHISNLINTLAYDTAAAVVPEPVTTLLFGGGILGIVFLRKKLTSA